MNEIIKVKNEGYGRYEEVLIERDNLRKEARLWKLNYMAELGDFVIKSFEKKLECIKKKKIISFCQAAINKGEVVNQDEMQEFIEAEMEEYNRQLDEMIDENAYAKEGSPLNKGELSKIKKLYHKLAKQIHPDINPKTEEIPELKNLWQMIVVSYNNNNLAELEEAEVLVGKVLSNIGLESFEIEIPNLSEKIAKVEEEIVRIKTTNPYQYKYLLMDKEAVEAKKAELQKEIGEFEKYEKELDQILHEIMTKGGVKILWKMN